MVRFYVKDTFEEVGMTVHTEPYSAIRRPTNKHLHSQRILELQGSKKKLEEVLLAPRK